jgi:hypothetical protein
MASDETRQKRPTALGRGRGPSLVLPHGYSYLSVPIPTKALKLTHIQALRSDMPWQEYMSRLCTEAPCYEREAISKGHEPAAGPGG